MAASCCSSHDSQPPSTASSKIARWLYLAHYALTFLAAWLLRNHGAPLLQHTYWARSCPSPPCLGKQAVLRVSLGCFCLHTLLVAALLCVRSPAAQMRLHTGWWLVKAPAALAALLLPFALPSVVVHAYGELARVLSGLFLLVQLILLLDSLLTLNEALIDRRRCIPVLVTLSALSLALYVAGVTAACLLFAPTVHCGLHIGLIVSNLVLTLFILVLSVQPLRLPTAGLLTGALVALYGVFLLLGGLSSSPVCNQGTASSTTALQVVGFLAVFAALLWATSGSSVRVGTASETLSYRADLFHCMYALSGCYLAMLLLSWNLEDTRAGVWEVDRGYFFTMSQRRNQHTMHTSTITPPPLP